MNFSNMMDDGHGNFEPLVCATHRCLNRWISERGIGGRRRASSVLMGACSEASTCLHVEIYPASQPASHGPAIIDWHGMFFAASLVLAHAPCHLANHQASLTTHSILARPSSDITIIDLSLSLSLTLILPQYYLYHYHSPFSLVMHICCRLYHSIS